MWFPVVWGCWIVLTDCICEYICTSVIYFIKEENGLHHEIKGKKGIRVGDKKNGTL